MTNEGITPIETEPLLAPLPFSKPTRVWMELVRTGAALTSATVNAVVLLRVFGKL